MVLQPPDHLNLHTHVSNTFFSNLDKPRYILYTKHFTCYNNSLRILFTGRPVELADLQEALAQQTAQQAALIQMSGFGMLGPLLASTAAVRQPIPPLPASGIIPHPTQQVIFDNLRYIVPDYYFYWDASKLNFFTIK